MKFKYSNKLKNKIKKRNGGKHRNQISTPDNYSSSSSQKASIKLPSIHKVIKPFTKRGIRKL